LQLAEQIGDTLREAARLGHALEWGQAIVLVQQELFGAIRLRKHLMPDHNRRLVFQGFQLRVRFVFDDLPYARFAGSG
jgi:hypothetical protein